MKISVARSILKFSIFIFFVLAFVKPIALLLLSVANDDIGFANYAASFMGMLLRITIMYVGMLFANVISRSVQRMRMLQIVVGIVIMGGTYILAKYAYTKVVIWGALVVSSAVAVSWALLIGLAALIIFIWKLAGPWAFIAYLMLKDENEN